MEKRWQTALHEAAHLVVGRKLNRWDCRCGAHIYFAGGGFATLPEGLTEWATMVSTAAGARAERLARLFPPPPMPPAVPEIGAEAGAVIADAQQAYLRRMTPDEVEISKHCIKYEPGNFKDWVRRATRITAAARLEVWRHRREIVAIAERLYQTGCVIFEGDPADNRFWTGDAVAAGQ
jgi:hypothetical protein